VSGGIHIFWILSRAAGISAIVLASFSVFAGLLAGRGSPIRIKRFGEMKPLHEALSLATILLVVAHGLLLLADSWLKPGLAGIAIPFQMSYQPFWTGVGIIGGYGLIILGLTFYLRRWIGPSRWRTAHRFIAVFWILGLFHTFGAGTDAGALWLQALVAVTALPSLILLGMRLGDRKPSSKPKPPIGESRKSIAV